MLKYLRNGNFHAEDYNPDEWERIKDLFAYLLIPLPENEPARASAWDPSTCAGIIRLQESNIAIVQQAAMYSPGSSKVLGAESGSRFSVKLGSSMGVFSLFSVGFISSDDFKSAHNSYPAGWSVSFSSSGGCNLLHSYCIRYIPECTLTAIHRVKRGDIIFKVTSKDGEDVAECNFHNIPRKELFPYFACYTDKNAGHTFNTFQGTSHLQNTQNTPHMLVRFV